MSTQQFKRVLVKLSGEALSEGSGFGVSAVQVDRIARDLKSVVHAGTQVAVVVGGGNYFRGGDGQAPTVDRATADYMGMIGTILNALPLQDSLERLGVPTRVQSALQVQEVAEPYIRRRAVRHLEKGRVVIFAAGTGNPFVTTDTAAAFRALEIGADAILMAKNGVAGVYDDDPRTHADAKLIDYITHADVVSRGLRVMDQTALTLCGEHNLPIHVFDMDGDGNILRITRGERIGTLVSSTPQAVS